MNYPIWWDTDITIYNKHEDRENGMVTWYRTVLHNCFFKDTNNKITVGQTVLETNNIIVRIPQNDSFKAYGEWRDSSVDKKEKCFTIHQGDIIVKGVVEDIIDEYAQGKRSTDLVARYKESDACLVVNKWQDNTGIGRCAPHYYVSGE